MNRSLQIEIHKMAEGCVAEMGDIFWDYVPQRDHPLGFREPYEVAVDAVESMLTKYLQENSGERAV